jgi:hypothetical protein
MGQFGEFGLLEAQQGTGRADLFRGDLHERNISVGSAFVQNPDPARPAGCNGEPLQDRASSSSFATATALIFSPEPGRVVNYEHRPIF